MSGANGWTDPHNNGTYTLIGETADLFELSRLTGDGKYTDLINFAFGSSGSGCSVKPARRAKFTASATQERTFAISTTYTAQKRDAILSMLT